MNIVTTFIDNCNFTNSKTFLISKDKNIHIDKLCKNKLNFIPKKLYNDMGIQIKIDDKIPRIVFCCRNSNESYNFTRNEIKIMIQKKNKNKDDNLELSIKSCAHNRILAKHKQKDHIHNFGNRKQYKYRCLLYKKIQKRDYINPYDTRKNKKSSIF